MYNDGHDDENYDYKISLNETINHRYEVLKKLGKVRTRGGCGA